MTCAHVLGLIDAGPLADYPRAHLEAAWAHARECPTCGPALAMATALTSQLRSTPAPAAPDLTSRVMARIETIEYERASMPAADEPASAAQAWPAWATALGGLTTAGGMIWSMTEAAATPFGLAAKVGGFGSLLAMPSGLSAAIAIVCGLGLYVTGLFRPSVSRRA